MPNPEHCDSCHAEIQPNPESVFEWRGNRFLFCATCRRTGDALRALTALLRTRVAIPDLAKP